MNTKRLHLLLILFVALGTASVAQDPVFPTEESVTSNEEAAAKEEKALKFRRLSLEMLRETTREIETLRTPENRISLTADLVGLLWSHDPEEAREMFQVLTNSFTQLFTQYSGQVNAAGVEDDDLWNIQDREKAKAGRRMLKALVVRENLARAAAAKDPLLALEFVMATSSAVRGGTFSTRLEESDIRTKELIVELFGARDKETARELGRRLLKEGFDSAAIALLRTIRAEDGKEGAEFAREVFSAAGRDIDGLDPDFAVHANLLNYATETFAEEPSPDRLEMIPRDYVAAHASAFGRAVMRQDELDMDTARSYADAIRPYSESLADRIVKKFEIVDETESPETRRLQALLEKSRARDAAKHADAADSEPGAGDGPVLLMSTEGDSSEGALPERVELINELKGLKEEGIPDEKKLELMNDARTAADAEKTAQGKIMILTAAAVGFKRMGDERLADELINEALGQVTANPRTYEDFLNIWILAGGLSQVRPDIAFGRLEGAIFRINDVVNAGITIAEFIDVEGDLLQDGEVLIGAFASGVTSDMTRVLGAGDSVIRHLAESDLARTKALAEKFDRAEVRILAKTLVLGVILSEESDKDLPGPDFLEGN